ncbi:hypothetical protein Zmor_021442 [Zophobas morio]|uniref:Gustatory receptor n=2 Tax=Zophobas morio TaxID=2755281 RepID=A0AA38MBG4_9CUCU|nr:hypothetical protein Zmor_021442 [Zophobas morio]
MNQPSKKNDQIQHTNYLGPEYAVYQRTNIVKIAASPSVYNPDDQPDPDLLEQYDNFYQTTKSLLVLFQIMGVMPIERSAKGKTTFRWLSSTSIYAYCIFAGETIFVSMVFRERLNLILQPGKRFDEYIYGIIFLSILIPHFMLPVAAWTNGAEVAKFKNMWTRFQLKYFQVTGTPIIFRNLSLITYTLCIMSWVMGVAVMLAQFYLQTDMLLWHTFGYYHILAMLNCLCSLWFINCTAKGRVAVWMVQNLHKALESPDPANLLGAYRDLWVDLSHMMQQLGKAYSGMYSMYCLLILLTTIVASYGSVTEIMDQGLSFKEAGLFIIAFYCMTLLYVICNEAHHASRKMGPQFRETLLNVNLSAVDQRTRQEVNMFLTAIDKNPPTMNLNGYANVNRKLISSTVTSIVTYLVMLMQFRLTLMRNAQLAARRANASLSSGNTTTTSQV